MIRLVTTADTEILAAAAAVERLPAGFPEVRCANPASTEDPAALVGDVLAGARVVLCRILGGRRGWSEGFDLLRARCEGERIPLLALGGELEPDAELAGLSLAPPGAVAQAAEYLRHGDVDNVEQLLRFLADTFLLEGFGFAEPRPVPDLGVYVPGRGDVALEDALATHRAGRPTIGVCFYRSHRLTGNTGFVDAFCAAVQAARGTVAQTAWITGTPSAARALASQSCQDSPTPSPPPARASAAPEPPVASMVVTSASTCPSSSASAGTRPSGSRRSE